MSPKDLFEHMEDFDTVSTYWTYSAGGESPPTSWDGEPGHLGVIRFTTGTGATNRSGMHDGISTSWRFGGGESTFETPINLVNLSDGSETYALRVGWGDSLTGDFTDGVYFRYVHSTSANWQLVARTNSVETATTSSTAVATGWLRLTIVVNAAGTSAEFFVNGVSIGTVASNIPTAAGRECGVYITLAKSVGTTARTMYMDYIYIKKVFTTPR